MSLSLAKDGVEVSIVWCQGHDMSLQVLPRMVLRLVLCGARVTTCL